MSIIKIEYNGEKQYCTVPQNCGFTEVAQAGKLIFSLKFYMLFILATEI